MKDPTIMRSNSLDFLLAPKSIAIVGASPKKDSNGLAMVEMCKIDGYTGSVFLINPNYDEINGEKCYAKLEDLNTRPDHVIIGVASRYVEDIFDQCVEAGARAVTIFAACYLENDLKPQLIDRILSKANKNNIEICGPNCMGFYNPQAKLRVASFPSSKKLSHGGIVWIAQSGSAFGALSRSDGRLGFSLCVSTGMELKTTASDYMQWALQQKSTRVIGLFIEAIRDPANFISALEEAKIKKIPVVILKVGKTEKSAKMALSHTGALVGNHLVYQGVFNKFGVIEVNDMDEMAATLALFDLNKVISTGDLVTVHDSGGERELIVDLCEELDVNFADISAKTKKMIDTQLEPGLVAENPIDIFGTNNNYIERYAKIIEYMANDSNTAICLFMANPNDNYWYANGYAEAIKIASQKTKKVVALVSNISLVNEEKIALDLSSLDVPLIRGAKNALLASKHFISWAKFINSTKRVKQENINDRDKINFWNTKLAQSVLLTEFEGLSLFKDFEISTSKCSLINSLDDLSKATDELSFPLVLKTAENINHKSDVNGVKLNLTSQESVESAYQDLCNRLGKKAVLMEMAEGSVEICVGAIVDPEFGPVIILSAGGTLVELFDDRVSSLAPIHETDVKKLLKKLKIYRLFGGVRGGNAVDLKQLCKQISRISEVVFYLRDSLSEVDINPLICSKDKIIAVDCLVVGRKP